ncbi:unnamed protein product, partial [marine sediment metagenome]
MVRTMSQDNLMERTMRFGLRVRRLARALPRNDYGRAIGGELERTVGSIGAHYRAACRARSTHERIEQLWTAEEDADDSAYWMEVVSGARLMRRERLVPLLQEAHEIAAIMAAARESASRRRKRKART